MHRSQLEELVALLDTGLEQRAVAHTELNAESSRSHLLVSIVLTSTNRRSGKKTRGKLMLVDLAGSERVKNTGSTGSILNEAKYINRSLTYLEQCVVALGRRGGGHVAYRQTKLTSVLKDALGGNLSLIHI